VLYLVRYKNYTVIASLIDIVYGKLVISESTGLTN
jgi:hypothetical protein